MLICAISIICLAVVLVLKDSLRTYFKSLSLSLGVRSRRSLSLSWSLGVRSGLVLVLVLGGQVLVLVLVLGGQVLVNIPGEKREILRMNDAKSWLCSCRPTCSVWKG